MLKKTALESEAIERAKGWTFPNETVAEIRGERVGAKVALLRRIVDHLDIAKLRDYRNWVLAHTTLNPTPPLTYLEVWEIADATLRAHDALCSAVLGDSDDTAGIATARREQSLFFWKHIEQP